MERKDRKSEIRLKILFLRLKFLESLDQNIKESEKRSNFILGTLNYSYDSFNLSKYFKWEKYKKSNFVCK